MARSRTTPLPQPADAASRIDDEVVRRAYGKVITRQELTQAEREAVKRHEKQKEERLRRQYYRSIPQKHWREMSGRQTKVINEQAIRYGIPFGGAKIDLPAVVKAIHDFLAENAVKLARDDDVLLQGGSSPALELYREERAKIARFDRLERERQLLPRDEVNQSLSRIAAILRGAGDAIQRQFGVAAREILDEALADAQREMDRSFGEVQADHDDAPDVS